MHPKVHIGIFVFLKMDNKYLFNTVISYYVLMYQILEGKYGSNSCLVKPRILDVSCYHLLVIYDHFPSISAESYLLIRFVDPLHDIFISE